MECDRKDYFGSKSKSFFAFYDLAVSPATFDIVKFLLMAEISRKQQNKENIRLIIVPGFHQGFRSEKQEHNLNEAYWRVRNILVGCSSLLKSCSGFTYCTTRIEAKYYEEIAGSSVFPKNIMWKSHQVAI